MMFLKVKKLVVFLASIGREFHNFADVYCHELNPYVVVLTFGNKHKFAGVWKENMNEQVHLLTVQILYGIIESGKNKQLMNQLLLVAKYHIFSSYTRKERSFGRFLLAVYEIEQQIAIKNRKGNFNRKWNVIYKI